MILILLHINILSAVYSIAGSDSIENMKFLIKETKITTFQIDVPWRDYHLNSISSGDKMENTFASLDPLKKTLDNIRKSGGKVIIQLSVHYIPEWFLKDHKDKLLRNYRGSFEIQSEDFEEHYIPSPYSDLVKYQIIGAWYDYMGRFFKENYSDIIEYINPGILEEGQMSYPWSGYDGDELVFWSFDSYALEGYRSYLERIFSLNKDDKGRTLKKLKRINKKYGTFFLTWNEVRPPQTFEEVRYYKIDKKGNSPYFIEFLEFYAEGPLSLAKLYSEILQQYFPKEKLIIKIPHWHRSLKNKRTFTEGRFTNYYIENLKDYYKNIIFLPVQDPDDLVKYINYAKNNNYKVFLEPTIKVGDWKEVDDIIRKVDIDGINIVNLSDLLGDNGKKYRKAYKKWILFLDNNSDKK